jgi:hypothetical protein
MLINRVGFRFSKTDLIDGYWIIGMLSDLTLKGKRLKREIEKVKKDFPEYSDIFDN